MYHGLSAPVKFSDVHQQQQPTGQKWAHLHTALQAPHGALQVSVGPELHYEMRRY